VLVAPATVLAPMGRVTDTVFRRLFGTRACLQVVSCQLSVVSRPVPMTRLRG